MKTNVAVQGTRAVLDTSTNPRRRLVPPSYLFIVRELLLVNAKRASIQAIRSAREFKPYVHTRTYGLKESVYSSHPFRERRAHLLISSYKAAHGMFATSCFSHKLLYLQLYLLCHELIQCMSEVVQRSANSHQPPQAARSTPMPALHTRTKIRDFERRRRERQAA